MSTFDVRIVTPDGVGAEYSCDSVCLQMSDDRYGKNGGSLGIRKGHADAVIALTEGKIEAKLDGNVVFRVWVSGGFAVMKNGELSILAEHISQTDKA